MQRRSRSKRHGAIIGLLVVGLLAASCSPIPSSPRGRDAPEGFSGELAQAHAESLAGLGARSPGSRADRRARRYLTREFRAAGASVHARADGELRHLVAEVPGESPDVFLVVTPYPALDRDDWIGDSGPALLLELARVMARERPRYTLRFVLAEIREERFEIGSEEQPVPSPAIERPVAGEELGDGARSRLVAAGESLARALAAEGDLEGLRAVVVLDTTARPGLRIARDLRSHPIYREVFWESASALGQEAVFPSDGAWASPQSLHLGLSEAAMDRVLALVDEERARPERTPVDSSPQTSAEAFEAVGAVSVEGLGRIMHRLSRIDAFVSPSGAAATSGQASPQIPGTPPST